MMKFAWRLCIVNLVRSFFKYLTFTYGSQWPGLIARKKRRKLGKQKAEAAKSERREILKDLEVGIDALTRALRSTWWELGDGSTCFFWR